MADDTPIIQQVDAFRVTESLSTDGTIRVVTLQPVDLSHLLGTRWWHRDPQYRARTRNCQIVVYTVVGFTPRARGGDGLPMVRLASTARKPGSKPVTMAVTYLTQAYERAPE